MSEPTPGPGQVWADNDPRSAGRTLRLDHIIGSGDDAEGIFTILTNSNEAQRAVDSGSSLYRDRRGKTVRIKLRRLRPSSTGYRLLADATDC